MKEYKPGDIFERGRERIILQRLDSDGDFRAYLQTRGRFSAQWPIPISGNATYIPASAIPLMLSDGWKHVAGPTWVAPTATTLCSVTYVYPPEVK